MRQPYSRRTLSRKVREEAAEIAFLRDHSDHPTNGEESAYRNLDNASPDYKKLNYIANHCKGLHHDINTGIVKREDYEALLKAIISGDKDDFERIPLGADPPPSPNIVKPDKFTNPQAGLAFDLEGPDGHSLMIPPAPRIDGLEAAAEIVELYWMARLRDVNFAAFADPSVTDQATKNLIKKAIDDLDDFGRHFKGPKDPNTNDVTTATLFRSSTPGNLIGPYLSQFLLKDIKYGTLTIKQLQNPVQGGSGADFYLGDYLKDFPSWLAVQNGDYRHGQDVFDPAAPPGGRHIINGRDLSHYVHFDELYEAYLNACLILIDMNAPVDPGNPYTNSHTQKGFGTFGGPHILSLVTEVATRALKAVWFQKWFIHRRLRPEEFGGIIHNVKTKGAAYKIDKKVFKNIQDNVLNKRIFTVNNNIFLLPQAFPEGCPTHPSYGAGHATVAGACVTILKAWFDESYILPNPKIPNPQGTALIDYNGPDKDDITVGGELNKVAANISLGRNWAGVHYRSDYTESLKLGEMISIGILEEQKLTYNEDQSLSVTKFDGTSITI
jgi:hypothetical protein